MVFALDSEISSGLIRLNSLIPFQVQIFKPVRSVMAYPKLSKIEYTFEEVNMMNFSNLKKESTQFNPYQAVPGIIHYGFNVREVQQYNIT